MLHASTFSGNKRPSKSFNKIRHNIGYTRPTCPKIISSPVPVRRHSSGSHRPLGQRLALALGDIKRSEWLVMMSSLSLLLLLMMMMMMM